MSERRGQTRARTVALLLWATLSGAVYAQVKVPTSGGSGGILVGDSPTLTGTWTFSSGFIKMTNENGPFILGTNAVFSDAAIFNNTVQTPDAPFLGTGTISNSWIIAERQDYTFDFAHAQAIDPTLFIHSHNQNTTQWLGLFNNGSHSVIASGTSTLVWRAGHASTNYWYTDTSAIVMVAPYQFGWVSSSTDAAGSPDAVLTREGAAILQHGLDLNGAAITQTDKACDGITGTDIAGCDFIFAGGRGTGIGAPGDAHLQTAKDLATGTTAQTLFERHFYRGKAKALTESSATTFITFNIPTSLTAVGGEVRYCVHATDGTEVQERCGDEDFACINKAGTVTASTPNLLGTEATVIPSGTLTNAMTMTTSGTTCSMQANAASSLTQTILDIRYSVEIHGSGTVTP